MRRGLAVICMLFLAVVMSVQANVLLNPGFEEGDTGQMNLPIPGWNTWGSNGWHHNDAGRTFGEKAVKLWWTDSGYWQDFDVTEGHTYVFSGYMAHFTGEQLRDPDNDPEGEGNKNGIFKAEWYGLEGIPLGQQIFATITKDSPVDVYLYFSAEIVAPAGATVGRFVIASEGTEGDGAVNYDNVSVYDKNDFGIAFAPNPVDGGTVSLALADLFWETHDPNGFWTYDVYLEAEGVNIDPNFYAAPIATGLTVNAVNLIDAGVTLMDNTIYTWRVDTTDPNNGAPKLYTGDLWTFQVGDVAPVVDAGSNQYLWVGMEDGDADPAKVTFTITGTYTDDGNSAISRAQWVQGSHEGGGTVTIESQSEPVPGTVEAVVSATNTGWLSLRLEVDDAVGTGTDTVNVGIYGTCLEAALQDPDDNTIETKWPNGQHGDINGDCKTDLEDFAFLASSWLDCMTVKAGCTPF